MPEPQRETERVAAPQPAVPAGGGGCAAFEEVYLRYALRLRKISVRKFGIPPVEAETLVHDVFATYLTHASSVRTVEPYLVGAICNASRQWLRRNDAADALFCGETPCLAAADAAMTEEIERKLLLSRMLAGIGDRCRDLLHRYYANGESTRSIADALQSTPATIHVFLHKCRRRALAAYQAMAGRG